MTRHSIKTSAAWAAIALATVSMALPATASAEERRGGWQGQSQGDNRGGSNRGSERSGAERGGNSRGNGASWRSGGNDNRSANGARSRQQTRQQQNQQQQARPQSEPGRTVQAAPQRGWQGSDAQRPDNARPDRGTNPRTWTGNGRTQNDGRADRDGSSTRWQGTNRDDNRWTNAARDNDRRDNDRRDNDRRDNDDRWRNHDRDNRDGNDRWRGNDRNDRDNDRWRSNNRTWRDHDNRWSNRDHRRWDRQDWRRDNRYDWRSYRERNRSHYRIGRYYSPYSNWSYRRLSIGFSLGSMFYSDRYWINDPWSYRLPEVYGPYRWVRYYDDVLLVDIYSGEVVDVIYDFFW